MSSAKTQKLDCSSVLAPQRCLEIGIVLSHRQGWCSSTVEINGERAIWTPHRASEALFKLTQNAVILHAARNASFERVSQRVYRMVLGGAYPGTAGTGHINNSRRDHR